jgi:peptidoglycan hydrolase-like protein with peptidoglycan-binding domain
VAARLLDRARYEEGLDEAPERRRFLGRLMAVVVRNPGRSLASVFIVAAVAAVAVNAAFFQTGDHPSPLFNTRPADEPVVAAAAPPAETNVPLIAPRETNTAGHVVELTTAATPQVQVTAASPSVVEAQRLLAQQGYDPGLVDGLFGGRTRTAIESYQRAQGLPVTGVVNENLLDQLRRTAADPTTTAAVQRTEADLILAVQTALNQTAFGPVVADGRLTEETRDAIRGFQLHYGLTLTGQVDEALVARMIAIGALDPL